MDIANPRALGTSQAVVRETPDEVRQTGSDVGREILGGPNVLLEVALSGLDAAMQIAKNMGVSPEERAAREKREKEQRKKDDLKDDLDKELTEEERQRERQETENIIAAALLREGGGEIV